MQRKIGNDYCLVTGIVTESFKKNANNVDIKRPCLNIKVFHEDGMGQPHFTDICVLCPGGVISKIAVRYKPGDIIDIQGRVCFDNREGIYIEANTIQLVYDCKGDRFIDSISKILQLPQILNIIFLSGTQRYIDGEDYIVVHRYNLSKGDLTNKDTIPLLSDNHCDNKKVLITGRIGFTDKLCIIADETWNRQDEE